MRVTVHSIGALGAVFALGAALALAATVRAAPPVQSGAAAGAAQAASESPAASQTPAASAAAAADLDRRLVGLATWSADFKQTIEDGNGRVLRSAAGRLYLKKPGRFRWDYVEPSEQLIVGDGKRIWFYDKDLAQANVRKVDSSLANTPALLLSGTGSVASQFDVSALPDSDGLHWFQLVPKRNDTDFLAVRVGFAGDELQKMLLADKLNQVTRVTFSHAARNQKLASDLFSFTPPAGVDVIGLDSK